MKILHILYQSIPNTAGSSIRSRDIINSQLAEGLMPIVITSPFQAPLVKGEKEDIIEGVRYYRTFSGKESELVSEQKTGIVKQIRKAIRLVTFTVRVYKIAKKEKVDILHAHAMFFCAIAARITSILQNKPMLYEIRSLWEERYKNKNIFSNILFGCITFIETISMFISNELIAINGSLKEELASRKLLKNKKIHIVENAVNLDRIVIKSKNRSVKTFAYIGTISPIEGLDLLVEAFTNLHKAGLKNKLVLYGDGVMLNDLKKLAKSNSLIEFRGRFSQAEITDVYSEVDIVINPRRKSFLTNSVTPLKPLEAMGYQKLIMASDIGGMREIIKNNKTGLLFKSDSVEEIQKAILNVLERKDIETLVLEAFSYVKNNRSWKENGRKYKAIYKSIINE